jgi:hypothetical protein
MQAWIRKPREVFHPQSFCQSCRGGIESEQHADSARRTKLGVQDPPKVGIL